jgi:ABC-type branched-subunit amino acid transport system substrate-binding protein
MRRHRAAQARRGLTGASDAWDALRGHTFRGLALIQQAGRAAEGVVVSVPVVDPARLPAAGRRFVEAFEQAIEGQTAAHSAPTAQATEVLLDAIAASDGTRASVTRILFRTRVENGILGSFGFDANGDTTAGGVTIYSSMKVAAIGEALRRGRARSSQ